MIPINIRIIIMCTWPQPRHRHLNESWLALYCALIDLLLNSSSSTGSTRGRVRIVIYSFNIFTSSTILIVIIIFVPGHSRGIAI